MNIRDDAAAVFIGKRHLRRPAVTGSEWCDIAADRHGFTLIELLMVLAVLATLIILAVPSYNQFSTLAKQARAREEIRTIEKAITNYIVDKGIGVYPPDLAAVGHGNTRDPWGQLYQYRASGSTDGVPRLDRLHQPLNTDYDLYSLGPNGNTDTVTGDVTTALSSDDVLRAGNGGDVALAESF